MAVTRIGFGKIKRRGGIASGSIQASVRPKTVRSAFGIARFHPKGLICEPSCWTAKDLLLFQCGQHRTVYEKLGAHSTVVDGKAGYAFSVWAPHACRVSVVGDFNHWMVGRHPMHALGTSGIWECFIPELQPGQPYKYAVVDRQQVVHLKADPYGYCYEQQAGHASILCEPLTRYVWQDAAWLERRARKNMREQPLSIYELHVDSWRRDAQGRPLTYRELAKALVAYLRETGFTHVEFMPLAEHPFTDSWGYQVTGFYAPTSRYGSPEDFQFLVDTLHRANIGVIMDWVPGHFPKDAFGLVRFDGTALYEHEDPRKGVHPDWGTLLFNYGRNEVRNFLMANALFWLDRFHVDGLRMDAVASMLYLDYSRKDGEWIPNRFGGKEHLEAIDFLRTTNDWIHQAYPGVITIAEESSAFGRVSQPTKIDGLGFDFKWNMGWMHDVTAYCQLDPIFRKYHHNKMTFGMLYQRSENFIHVFSHDEVVYGKGSMVQKMGSVYFSDKLSTLRALYGFMWGWPGKKTLFMGNEFAQIDEWDFHRALHWELLQNRAHAGVQRLISDLNRLYKTKRFWAAYDLYEGGFNWINPNDCDNSVFSFMRKNPCNASTLLFVSNFTPLERHNYACGVPFPGDWHEILNTDAAVYGGMDRGNCGSAHATKMPRDLQPCTLTLYLPPLSTLIFEYK